MHLQQKPDPSFFSRVASSFWLAASVLLFSGLTSFAFWPPLQDVWWNRANTNGTEWRITFGVYDPVRDRSCDVDTGWFQAANAGVTSSNGIVVWYRQSEANASPTLSFNIYDPALGVWQTTNLTWLLPQMGWTVSGGVVAWVERSGLTTHYLGASTYDPGLQRWMVFRTNIVTESVIYAPREGMAAYLTLSGSTHHLHCVIYDPLLQSWRTRRYGPYPYPAVFSFVNGSIVLRRGNDSYVMGYNSYSGNWTDNSAPARPIFHATPTTGTAPLAVWFTDLSLSATIWEWSFGDGSPTNQQRSPVHTFSTPGLYDVQLKVGSQFTNVAIYVGPPTRLEHTGMADGRYYLQLVSATNTVHVLEHSTNLQHWDEVRSVTNFSGTLNIEQAVLSEEEFRFFRTRLLAP